MGTLVYGCGPGKAVDRVTHERISDQEWTRRYWEGVIAANNCNDWAGRAKAHQQASDAAGAMEARYARG
ncbi:MAG: hypothetical protein IT365_06440 [Candidatus Hydrogenedentes bacterium]|nr:hypothetical protein [Candidatus Hydrogenedentota bacterium]